MAHTFPPKCVSWWEKGCLLQDFLPRMPCVTYVVHYIYTLADFVDQISARVRCAE